MGWGNRRVIAAVACAGMLASRQIATISICSYFFSSLDGYFMHGPQKNEVFADGVRQFSYLYFGPLVLVLVPVMTKLHVRIYAIEKEKLP